MRFKLFTLFVFLSVLAFSHGRGLRTLQSETSPQLTEASNVNLSDNQSQTTPEKSHKEPTLDGQITSEIPSRQAVAATNGIKEIHKIGERPKIFYDEFGPIDHNPFAQEDEEAFTIDTKTRKGRKLGDDLYDYYDFYGEFYYDDEDDYDLGDPDFWYDDWDMYFTNDYGASVRTNSQRTQRTVEKPVEKPVERYQRSVEKPQRSIENPQQSAEKTTVTTNKDNKKAKEYEYSDESYYLEHNFGEDDFDFYSFSQDDTDGDVISSKGDKIDPASRPLSDFRPNSVH